jgi:hypothetical protein
MISRMSAPYPSGQRPRTCRACGRKYEYPVKGSDATCHHCADCVTIPADTRKILERLNTRVLQLENQLRRLQEKSAAVKTS